MTASGEYVSTRGGGPGTVSQSSATKVFGIEITPTVGGLILALLGIGLTAYFIANYTLPKREELTRLETEIATAQQDIDNQQQRLAQLGEIRRQVEEAKQLNTQVLSLFADERIVNSTLLLDLEQKAIQASGTKLTKFAPLNTPEASGPVSDGSLGQALNGKIRRQTFEVGIEGGFSQTLNTMRNLERLQALTEVQNLESKVIEPEEAKRSGLSPSTVITTFNLVAYIPLSPQEMAAAQAAAQPTPGATPGAEATPAATPSP